jgi:hypothetical protein
MRRSTRSTSLACLIPLASPAANVATTGWFPTNAADFLKIEIWRTDAADCTLDLFTPIFSKDGITAIPIPQPTIFTFAPTVVSATLLISNSVTNPLTFYMYSSQVAMPNIAFENYIAFTASNDTGDTNCVVRVTPTLLIPA